jgi:hypothetical protein
LKHFPVVILFFCRMHCSSLGTASEFWSVCMSYFTSSYRDCNRHYDIIYSVPCSPQVWKRVFWDGFRLLSYIDRIDKIDAFNPTVLPHASI